MSNAHQPADHHPWQPGAWVEDTTYDIKTDTMATVVVKDMSDTPREACETARLTALVLTEVIVTFARLEKHFARRPESLRHYLYQRQALLQHRPDSPRSYP